MSQPTAGDVHVNRPLTNMAVGFMQDADLFVCDSVFPDIPSDKQSDLYFEYPRGSFFRDSMEKRAPGTESAGGGYEVTTGNFFCDVWALHKDVPDQIRANADQPLNMDRDGTFWLTQMGMIRKEINFASTYLAGGIWTFDEDGVSGVPSTDEFRQWDDYTNSDPVVDIRRAKTAVHKITGFRPNTIVFGQEVWDKLEDHPMIIDRVKYGQTSGGPARVTQDAVAAILGVERVLVAGAVKNTAKEGQTDSFDFIGGKVAWIGYVPPNPGVMIPSAGYTFTWSGLFGVGGMGTRMSRFRMENLRSDRLEIEMAWNQKLISADLGGFFDTAIA